MLTKSSIEGFENISPLIQLKVPGKNNLCVDDDGVTKEGQSQMHLWTCDANNKNQQFIYNSTLKQLKNPNKNLCVDDGGATTAGATKFWLYTCDPNNKNQQFVYDDNTKMFKNPNKNNLCMDDGGATDSSGRVKMQLWNCDNNNSNQKFIYTPIPISRPSPYIMVKGGKDVANNICKRQGKKLCKVNKYCNDGKPIYEIDDLDKWGAYPDGWIQLGKNGDVCKTLKQKCQTSKDGICSSDMKDKEVAVLCCDVKYVPLVIDAIHLGNNNELTFFKGHKYQTITPNKTFDVKNVKGFNGLSNNFKDGNIDAITISNTPNSSLWFKGTYVMSYDNIKKSGIQTSISSYFSGLPNDFKEGGIDAIASKGIKTEYILFKNTRYCIVDMNTNKVISTGNIADKYTKLPNEFKMGYLDCILYSRPNISYIMKNDKLIEYNLATNTIIRDPVNITSVWPTLLSPFIPKNKECSVYEQLMKTDNDKTHWTNKYYKSCKRISKKEYDANLTTYIGMVNNYKDQYNKESSDRKNIELEIAKFEKGLEAKKVEMRSYEKKLESVKKSPCTSGSSNIRKKITVYESEPQKYYEINSKDVNSCIKTTA